jgi:hypothetical protein
MSKHRSFAAIVTLIVAIGGVTVILESDHRAVAHPSLHGRIAQAAEERLWTVKYKWCPIFFKTKNSLVPAKFVLAVVAVESYGRPALRRWLEELVAKTNFWLFGHVPDFSLGVGQVKMSAARRALQERPVREPPDEIRDSEVLAKLLSDCENIEIVWKYLDLLMGESGHERFDYSASLDVLASYNGQSSRNNRRMFYQYLVWTIYQDIQNISFSGWPEVGRTP